MYTEKKMHSSVYVITFMVQVTGKEALCMSTSQLIITACVIVLSFIISGIICNSNEKKDYDVSDADLGEYIWECLKKR